MTEVDRLVRDIKVVTTFVIAESPDARVTAAAYCVRERLDVDALLTVLDEMDRYFDAVRYARKLSAELERIMRAARWLGRQLPTIRQHHEAIRRRLVA